MNNNIPESLEELTILNDRYRVVIGKRGKVEVFSNVASGMKNRPMKVYGSVKHGTAFINMSDGVRQEAKPYYLKDIKESIKKCDTSLLQPIPKEEVEELFCKDSDNNSLLDNLLPLEEIHKLEFTPSWKNNKTFVAEVPIKDATIFYSKYIDYNRSNGFLKAIYNISLANHMDKFTTYHNSEYFPVDRQIHIKDLSTVPLGELEDIITMLKSELKGRM